MDLSKDEAFNPASLPPGYRFCPQDDELVVHYLRRKILHQTLPPIAINEVNLYAHDPDDLSVLHKPVGDGEWFYFTPRERRYKNGKRPKRSTGRGYWKATGTDKEIKFEDRTVGFRKTLVFYLGNAPTGNKTDWIMHEYRVSDPPKPTRTTDDDHDWLDDCVLCKVYKKHNRDKGSRRSRDDDESSSTDWVRRIEVNSNEVNDQSSVVGGMNSVEDLQDEKMDPQILNARAVFSNGIDTWLTNGDGVAPIQDMMNNQYNDLMIIQHQRHHPFTQMSQFSRPNPEISAIGGGDGLYPDQKMTSNQFNHDEIINNHHQGLQNQQQQQLAEFSTVGGGGGGQGITSYHFNPIINNHQDLQNQQQKQLAEFGTVGRAGGGGEKHTAKEITSYHLNPITNNDQGLQNQQQHQLMSEFSTVGGGGKHTAQEITSYHLNPITNDHQGLQNPQQQFMPEFSTVGGGYGNYTTQETTNYHFNPVINNHQGLQNQHRQQLPINQMPKVSRPNVVLPHDNIQHCPPAATRTVDVLPHDNIQHCPPAATRTVDVLPHDNIQHCPPASTRTVDRRSNNVPMQSMELPFFSHPWNPNDGWLYERSS